MLLADQAVVLDPIAFVVSAVSFIVVLIWLSSCLLLSEIFSTPVCYGRSERSTQATSKAGKFII